MKENQTKGLPPQEDLVPMNDNLRSEYSVKELEQRLETDPLLLSSLLSGDIMPLCECKKGYICVIEINVCSCDTDITKPCTCKLELDTEVDV